MEANTFTNIATRLRPRLLRTARLVLTDADEAEDVVQEVLLRLWTAWAQIDSSTYAERLGIRLTKHLCIDTLRSARVRYWAAMPAADSLADAPATSAATVREREIREALDRAVDALQPRERQLWQLHAEAGMSTAEIAATTGIGVRTVSSMLSAARYKILTKMKKGGYINE